MGKLIVIEGVSDCIGKSSQMKLLEKRLLEDNYIVTTHHFPSYGKVWAKIISVYLKGELGNKKEINPYIVSNFFAIDRYFAFNRELFNKDIILLDRYTTSNLIYQGSFFEGSLKDEFFDYILDYEYNKLKLPKPDIVIFLKMSKENAKSLRDKRNDKDTYEKDEEFLDRVYDNSLEVALKYNFKIIECDKDGVLRSKEDIAEEIYQEIIKIL